VTALPRLGLRVRLGLALVAMAVLAVGLATYVSNRGLHPRVSEAAEARLARSAEHMAGVAATVYREEGGWTPGSVERLEHLALIDRLEVELYDADGRRIGGRVPADGPSAAGPVAVGTSLVGRVVVSPEGGALLTPEDVHLQRSLNRLHLLAGAGSVLAALLLAFLLAQTLARPLRRIRLAAQRMEEGDLGTRIDPGGYPEAGDVAHALNRLAETLQHEEEVRKASVADLAHELRTPVNGLLGRIEAAQDSVLPDPEANLAGMHDEALRLARLLDDLAELAESEQPGLLVAKAPTDLGEVVRREVEASEPGFREKGVALAAELEPAAVLGDAQRLGQVVANLLSNALRYTDSGGEVRVRVAREGQLVALEVADTGMGIAPEDLQRIFKRFWRGERSRSRATGGTGIGLAVVEQLVRAHEGRVDVDSVPGRGSTFRVVLRGLPKGAHGNGRRRSPDPRIPARG
jgi:two-component system, OmpR family, sensor histidine kinase BaeS